ncbi:MAG TPA: hypothetical protein PK715_12885, partial [Chitinophagales bacterium]|nr:hypothetical protein [Chitinophagales bacterium]
MKIHTEPLKPLHYYHVYNRGINGCLIFSRKENYAYFLQKYAFYISPVATTYAYCLLGNHFHLLIAVRSEPEIMDFFMRRKTDETGKPYTPVPHTPSAGKVVSGQFAHLFNAYAQAFNKETKRSGGLFETPFRRKPVESSRYLNQVIAYIHQNPQKHRLVANFVDYPHSSY